MWRKTRSSCPLWREKGEPAVWNKYRDLLERYDEEKAFTGFSFLSRQEFYARARTAVAVVATGEREKYSNIILKLGVVK